MSKNLSSAAVVIGALRVIFIFSRSSLFHLPNIYLKPVLLSEFTEEEQNRRRSLYPCPVYINKVIELH